MNRPHCQDPLSDFAPEKDGFIRVKYGARSLKGKMENKLAFQKKVALGVDRRIPLVLVVVPFLSRDGIKLLTEILPGMLELGIQVFILEDENAESELKFIRSLAEQFPKALIIQQGGNDVLHEAFAACDIFLAPARLKRLGFGPMIALKYGTIPVMQSSEDLPILDDYDPVTEKGTAFLYSKDDRWSLFAALVRAIENFKLSFDWQRIQKNGMEVMG